MAVYSYFITGANDKEVIHILGHVEAANNDEAYTKAFDSVAVRECQEKGYRISDRAVFRLQKKRGEPEWMSIGRPQALAAISVEGEQLEREEAVDG